jgi:hypothetical protein
MEEGLGRGYKKIKSKKCCSPPSRGLNFADKSDKSVLAGRWGEFLVVAPARCLLIGCKGCKSNKST